jgi:hypothetical protein
MLTRTQALEGGANVTCISKVQFTYRSFIRLTILGHYATGLRLTGSATFVEPLAYLMTNGERDRNSIHLACLLDKFGCVCR